VKIIPSTKIQNANENHFKEVEVVKNLIKPNVTENKNED